MTTATVTRKLRAEGLPVELVRGAGYHYFVWDDGTHFETASEMVYRFRDLTVDQWVSRGRDFAAKVQAEIADRAEFAAQLVVEKAAREAKPAPAVETNFAVVWENKDGELSVSYFAGTTSARARGFAYSTLRRRPEFRKIVSVDVPVEAEPKPVVVRMARYEAAYMACHGRTVSVTWSGEKVRVLEHGGDDAFALFFELDELDAIAARMEAKVREKAERIERAANAPDDIFEALGLPRSASEGETR